MSREVVGDAPQVAGTGAPAATPGAGSAVRAPVIPDLQAAAAGAPDAPAPARDCEPAAAPEPPQTTDPGPTVEPRPQSPAKEPPDGAPAQPNRRGRRARPATRAGILAALALAGGLLGWVSFGSWQAAGYPRGDVVAVTAAVTGTSGIAGDIDPTRARLTVTVLNGGPATIRVVGHGPASPNTSVIGLDPPGLRIGPGQTGLVSADVAVRCGSAEQLSLPDLRIRTPAGGQRPLRPAGGSAALTEVCSGGPAPLEPLGFGRYRPVGDRLSVALLSPTGRPQRVLGVRAGGIRLTSPSLPVTVTNIGREILLVAPDSCPRAWELGGIPTRLEIDMGTAGTDELSLGSPLASWILRTACAPGT